MNTWNDLSLSEKSEMMRVAIENGITTLPEIRKAYNQFAEGGDTVGEWVDAIYQNNPQEEFLGEPSHHYDFTQSEEWANAHGYYPDARGHRDDRVKKPAHPSHPSRGAWDGDKFVLSELGMQNPNYTLFGLNDGGQDPQAVLTYQGGSVIPEITATPNGNYFFNPYDNIKLKFAEGGNLFSGEVTPTQQMNNGLNLYRRTNNLGETEYVYQETPDSEEILLTPTNKRFSDDPTNWDYKDASGREYSPRMVSPSSSSTLEASEKMGPLEKYAAELNWRAKNDPASITLKGKYTMPAIASAWLAPLGEAFAGSTIASIPATTWANTAIAAGFAGHGLNHTINESIDGWGDAAMTALELAPLGQLAKPMWNTGKTALANQVEKVTSLQQGMAGLSTSEKLGWLWNKGKLVQRKIPINKEHFYRAVRTEDALNDAIDNGVIRQGRHKPPMITFKGPFFAPGYISHERYGNYVFEGNPEHIQWIKPWPYHNNGEVIPWHPGVGSAFPYYEGSTTVPTTGFSYWKKYPFIGWRSRSFDSLPKKVGRQFASRAITPQITAENAASITPEQWTAAQDDAIARGDMVEAQRLRDLHFQVSAPNTVASVNGQPLQLYHGTDATFNAFDISKYGNTDGGTFGRGIYTTPVKTYAELYGENNMPLYMKLDNPRDYRNSSIGDLIAEKFAFGDDFATGNGIDGVIGRPSWKGFKGLEEYVSHNPKNIKSSLPITYDDNGVRIPLGERDNFNINDIRYFKDDFGKEVLITPYPGTDTQLVNAANEGHLAALRHQFSQDKTEQLKSVMGWDDAAIAEYQDEILRSSGNPADIQVRGTDTGFKEIGNHAGNISQNGESVSHSMTLNRDRIPDDATAIETGIHEMGVHGRTLSIDPSEIGVEGSYSNTIAQKFPRIAEVMKKNQEIAKQTLIPNDRGKLFQQIKKSSDLERWLYENNVPVEQWEEYFNDWKYYKYVTEDQELLARGYTGQVYETVDPSRETLNIQQLKKFFTPESTEKYKKAVLSTLPFLFTGYGLSQGNE